MAHGILEKYDRIREHLGELRVKTAAAKAAYDAALSEEKAVEHEFVATREALDALLGSAAGTRGDPTDASGTDVLDEMLGTKPSDSGIAPEAIPPAPHGVRPSFWELVYIMRNGEIDKGKIRDRLKVSDSALATRIQKAKKAGVIETAGWGRYRLTEEGRKIVSPGLRVVEE